MNYASLQNLELLKNRVIDNVGIDSIKPADCKTISILVNNKTRHCISETTLKRIYGFALSKFQPSLFTLDALAKFCDYTSWRSFCESNEPGEKVPLAIEKELSWQVLKKNAEKVTDFTLQVLKNRSGLPYTQTISRSFIDAHFEDFEHSGLTGTVITAPCGYGKTIALCHWIDKKLQKNDRDDIILLFSSTALASVITSGMDINHWLQALLGYGTKNNITNLNYSGPGKFYLVIDGFDNYKFRNEQFEILVNQVIDFFSLYQLDKKFKIVLTLHSSTWCNLKLQLNYGKYHWHTGFTLNNDCINTPFFNISEIKELVKKINPDFDGEITSSIAENFKHPLYLQFYTKKYKHSVSQSDAYSKSKFEIISLFIINKIYRGRNATEKALLINALVENMDFNSGVYKVRKLTINDTLNKYEQAFKELINDGILEESNEFGEYRNYNYIQFARRHYLMHSLSNFLLCNNGDVFDSALIGRLNNFLYNNELKLPVLKYCVIYAIETEQQHSLEVITEVELSINEKSDLVLFMGNLFNEEFTALKYNQAKEEQFKQTISEKFFDYFFGMELINNQYKDTLYALLKFELSAYQKIIVYTALALLGVINLDMEELELNINRLKNFNNILVNNYAVNPLTCLDALYHFFKYGIVLKEPLKELTGFYFQPDADQYNVKDSAANDLIHLLEMYTMLLADNPAKTLRCINAVQKVYLKTNTKSRVSTYNFFVNVLLLDVFYQLNNKQKFTGTYNLLMDEYAHNNNSITPLMEIFMQCVVLKYKCILYGGDDILHELKCINLIADKWGIKINKLVTLMRISHDDDFLTAHPAAKKQLNYDLMKMVNKAGLYKEAFISEQLL